MKYNISKDFLHTEYIINRKSSRQIAVIVGCHPSWIIELCKRYEIILRTKREALLGRKKVLTKKRTPHSEETKKKIGLANKGQTRKGVPLSDERKKKVGDFHRGKKLSTEQKQLYANIFKGKGNPNWKGGISSESNLIRTSEEYQQWRNKVIERDKWTCLKCNNGKGKRLNAHHIKSFKYFPDLRFDINNGVTLCRECHFSLHSSNRKAVCLMV